MGSALPISEHTLASKQLARSIFTTGCLELGTFRLSPHDTRTVDHYFYLRQLFGDPGATQLVFSKFWQLANGIKFQHFGEVSSGIGPIAALMANDLNRQLIRFNLHGFNGHNRHVDGHFQPGDTVLLVEDIIVTGTTSLQICELAESAGLKIAAIIALLDCEAGGPDLLNDHGYRVRIAYQSSQLLQYFRELGFITPKTDTALSQPSATPATL